MKHTLITLSVLLFTPLALQDAPASQSSARIPQRIPPMNLIISLLTVLHKEDK